MRNICKLFLFVNIFCNIAGAEVSLQKKLIIISDFDKVWINAVGLIDALAHLQPIESFLKSKPVTKGECDQEQRELHKFTLKFLDYGRCHPRLIPYIPDFIEYFGKSRCINQPINNLYCYLKNKGCVLVIATNKDRMLYDFAIESLGSDIPNMVEKVFVSEPKNDKNALIRLQSFADKSTIPKRYRDMVYKAINTLPTNKIFHVPSKKPHPQYFTYIINQLGPENDIIFIDDNIKNVEAFNALQKNCSYLRRGIVYKQNNPSQFIEELIKLKLVSEKEDKKLLDAIRDIKTMRKQEVSVSI